MKNRFVALALALVALPAAATPLAAQVFPQPMQRQAMAAPPPLRAWWSKRAWNTAPPNAAP